MREKYWNKVQDFLCHANTLQQASSEGLEKQVNTALLWHSGERYYFQCSWSNLAFASPGHVKCKAKCRVLCTKSINTFIHYYSFCISLCICFVLVCIKCISPRHFAYFQTFLKATHIWWWRNTHTKSMRCTNKAFFLLGIYMLTQYQSLWPKKT